MKNWPSEAPAAWVRPAGGTSNLRTLQSSGKAPPPPTLGGRGSQPFLPVLTQHGPRIYFFYFGFKVGDNSANPESTASERNLKQYRGPVTISSHADYGTVLP